MSMSIDRNHPGVNPRARLVVSGCLTAVAAGLFTIVLFDILTPPDPAALLNPPLAARPTRKVIPAVPNLFLDDDFTTREHWPEGGANSPYGYEQNGYRLDASHDPGFIQVPLKAPVAMPGHDLSLEVEANPMPGSRDVEYGVFFWHSQDQDGHERFLYFAVNTEGMYTLRALLPVTTTTATPAAEPWVDLVARTSSPTIKTDGKSNRLRVDVHPHRILAFINGELVLDRDNADVDAFRDRKDFDGGVGLITLALSGSTQKVLFSRFRLYLDVKS